MVGYERALTLEYEVSNQWPEKLEWDADHVGENGNQLFILRG